MSTLAPMSNPNLGIFIPPTIESSENTFKGENNSAKKSNKILTPFKDNMEHEGRPLIDLMAICA
jgi:hypothetical protein